MELFPYYFGTGDSTILHYREDVLELGNGAATGDASYFLNDLSVSVGDPSISPVVSENLQVYINGFSGSTDGWRFAYDDRSNAQPGYVAGPGYLLPGESDAHGLPTMAFSNPFTFPIQDHV